MENKEREYAEFSRKVYAMLNMGGKWGVPRSGLTFTKTKDGLELSDVLPYTPGMSKGFEIGMDVPASPSQLLDFQITDFRIIQRYNELAGLKVTDPNGLLSPAIKIYGNSSRF